MARYDFYKLAADTYLLDCQSETLSNFKTRFVVPLFLEGSVPRTLPRLLPVFVIDGTRYIMATHLASAVGVADLGTYAGSLSDEADKIIAALDMLISGY